MAELAAALAGLSRTETLLVALDFDGTLAPLVDDPDQARALPEAREAVLRLLALPRTRVALISGRAMASLLHVSDLPDTALLSGSHGVEVRLDAEPALMLEPGELDRVAELRALLDAAVAGADKVWIEAKPAGFAVHTRLASEAVAREANAAALVVVATLDDITVRWGSDVLEFSVRSTNKGDAVQRLKDFSGASAVFFAGDDVTDEDAFAALGPEDVGLKCGDGQTLATFAVASTADVARTLSELAGLRERETLR